MHVQYGQGRNGLNRARRVRFLTAQRLHQALRAVLGDLGDGGNGAWGVAGFSLTHGIVAAKNGKVEIDVEEQIILILGIGLKNPLLQGGVELYHEVAPLRAGKQLVNPSGLGIKGQKQLLSELFGVLHYILRVGEIVHHLLDQFQLQLIGQMVDVCEVSVKGGLVDFRLFTQLFDRDLFQGLVGPQLHKGGDDAPPGFLDSNVHTSRPFPTQCRKGWLSYRWPQVMVCREGCALYTPL